MKTTPETPRSQHDQEMEDGDHGSQEPTENGEEEQGDSCALPGETKESGEYPDPDQAEGVTLQPEPPDVRATLVSWFSPGTIAGHNITASGNEIDIQLPFVMGVGNDIVRSEGTDMVMRIMDNTEKGEKTISSMNVARNVSENDRAATPSIGTVWKPAAELSKDDSCGG